MSNQVTLIIDGKEVSVPAGTTILKAAEKLGIKIPTICYHDYCTSNGLCRICVVEVESSRLLVASCVARVSEGMVVHNNTERVRQKEYEVNLDLYPDAERRLPPLIDDNPMYIRDYSKCILCWRCMQVCAEDAQYTYAINFSARGFGTLISTFYERPIPQSTCVFCGQCIGVCPTGALKPKREWLIENGYTPEEIIELIHDERMNSTPLPQKGTK
jgi:NADH dehydrogenase/NADH:ubiquinone oxidoreductase subunit G